MIKKIFLVAHGKQMQIRTYLLFDKKILISILFLYFVLNVYWNLIMISLIRFILILLIYFIFVVLILVNYNSFLIILIYKIINFIQLINFNY